MEAGFGSAEVGVGEGITVATGAGVDIMAVVDIMVAVDTMAAAVDIMAVTGMGVATTNSEALSGRGQQPLTTTPGSSVRCMSNSFAAVPS